MLLLVENETNKHNTFQLTSINKNLITKSITKMKKIQLFAFILIAQFSFSQNITVGPKTQITNIELDYPSQISGYEVKDNVLKVYSLSTVKGTFPSFAKILDDLLKSSSNSNGSPLLIENEIDLNNLSLKKTNSNTIISLFSNEGFIVNKKSKIPQSIIEKVVLARDLNNPNAFPKGDVKTKYIDGSYYMNFKTGIPEFVSTPKKTELTTKNTPFGSISSSVNKMSDYNLPLVKGIKDKDNKIAAKLNFEVTNLSNDNEDKLVFKTAKDFLNSVIVTNINKESKGHLLVFKNDNVKEVEYLDPNPNNIIVCYYDSNGNKKYVTEISTSVDFKWIKIEDVFEENGELKVFINYISSLTKSELQLIKINTDGKPSKIQIPNAEEADKVINIQTKNRQIMGVTSSEYLKTLTKESNYAQVFEVSKNEINKGEKPVGELIKIMNKEYIPIKQYFIGSFDAPKSSEYMFLENGNSIIKSVNGDDFFLQLTNDDFVVRQINPSGYKRPEMIEKYNSIAQTNDKIYFVYVNKDNDYVVVSIEK